MTITLKREERINIRFGLEFIFLKKSLSLTLAHVFLSIDLKSCGAAFAERKRDVNWKKMRDGILLAYLTAKRVTLYLFKLNKHDCKKKLQKLILYIFYNSLEP